MIVCLCFMTNISAQDRQDEKIRELGISSSSFGSFQPYYKVKHEKKNFYFRIHGGYVGLTSLLTDNPNTNIGLSFRLGLEKRKPISPKIGLFYGIDYIPSLNAGFSNRNSFFNLINGIGFGSGINYKLTNRFHLTFELLPTIRFATQFRNDRNPTYSLNIDINSSPIALGVSYRL